jgi:hypothetical protein
MEIGESLWAALEKRSERDIVNKVEVVEWQT